MKTGQKAESFAMDAVMSCQIARLSTTVPSLVDHRLRSNTRIDQVSAYSVEVRRTSSSKLTWQTKAWGKQQSQSPTTTSGAPPNTAFVPLPTGAEVRIAVFVVVLSPFH